MAVVLERLISIETRKKSVYVTVSTFYTLLRQTPRQIKMALSEKVKNEIPRTPDLKIFFFFLSENDISNITLFYEVVFLCINIFLQSEKNTLRMKAFHEYALGVRVFKVISVLAIKDVLNAVWYKTFSQCFKESLGQTGLFPSKEMTPVEIEFLFYAEVIMAFLS